MTLIYKSISIVWHLDVTVFEVDTDHNKNNVEDIFLFFYFYLCVQLAWAALRNMLCYVTDCCVPPIASCGHVKSVAVIIFRRRDTSAGRNVGKAYESRDVIYSKSGIIWVLNLSSAVML